MNQDQDKVNFEEELIQKELTSDENPEVVILTTDENPSELERLILAYETQTETQTLMSISLENANANANANANRNSLETETEKNFSKEESSLQKSRLKQIFSLLKADLSSSSFLSSESMISNSNSEDLLKRVVKISLSSKKVIELLHILIENEKDIFIFHLFSLLSPPEVQDYEDSAFVLSDYLTRKLDVMFKWLELSVQYNMFALYPVFSLGLRKLSQSSKLQEATVLLNYMMYYGVEISTCAINYFIEVLCRQEKIEEAQSFFTKFSDYKPHKKFPEEVLSKCKLNKLMLPSGINIVTYGTLIRSLCKTNHMDLALFYYESLKEMDLIKDEVIFNLLIDGCSKTSNLDRLRNIYFDMLDFNITPTIVTYNTIIDAYIRARDINSAWKIYDDILSKKITPDNFTYSTLFRGIRHKSHIQFLKRSFNILEQLKEEETHIDIILINVLLDSCVALKEDKLIINLFEKVKSNFFADVKPDIITFNTFVKGCAQMNLFDKADAAFELMFSQSQVSPNDVFFNTMIDVCVRSGNMQRVWTVIEKMKEVGIKPDNFTYSTIIKGLNKNSNLNLQDEEYRQSQKFSLRDPKSTSEKITAELDIDSPSELDLAFKLFENVKNFSKPDEILYNCIMDACLRFHKIDKMLDLYDEMLMQNIKPSSITCGIVIKAYGMKGNLPKALEVYLEMKREGIEVSSITYGCLINACIKNDNLQKAFELYEELGNNNIEMNTVLYTTLIKAYSKNRELNKVLEIFNQMKRDKNNTPNNITFNSVIDCCIKCEEVKLSEKILEEMLKSGIKPDIITFSTLIKGCLKKGELNKAIDYLNTMQKFEIKPDEVLLNSLLDGCEKMKKYSKAVEIFSYVRNFGVEPSMMSFSIMMKIHGKLLDFNSSKALLEEVKKRSKNVSLILFTCYMKTCFCTNHPDEALATYKQLKLFRLTADSITYSTLLNGLLRAEGLQACDDALVSTLRESLEQNIMLNEKIYYDIVKRLSHRNKEQSDELVDLLEGYDIHVSIFKGAGKKGNFNKAGGSSFRSTQKKPEGNINFLINSYKHKQPFRKTGNGTGSTLNDEKNSVTPVSTNKNEIKPLQMHSQSSTPLSQISQSYKKFTNMNTSDNNFSFKNYNNLDYRIKAEGENSAQTQTQTQMNKVQVMRSGFGEKSHLASVGPTGSALERPRFINSKKDKDALCAINSDNVSGTINAGLFATGAGGNHFNYFLNSNTNSESHPQGKNKKLNRF